MLIEFIYTSQARHPFSTVELTALQTQCQEHNRQHQITGVLLYDNQKFMQVLEGEQAAVEAIFDKIKQDPRHQHIEALIHNPIKKRNFAKWDMGLVDTSSCSTRPECITAPLTQTSSLSKRLLLAFSQHFEDVI